MTQISSEMDFLVILYEKLTRTCHNCGDSQNEFIFYLKKTHVSVT